jgi:apolipoprotein N-acyltransferase
MNNATRFGLAAASGLLLSLAFPSWLFPSFFPWTGWLAWFALVPALAAFEGAGPGRAFLAGWMGGFVYNASSLYWIAGIAEMGPVRHAGWLAVSAALGLYWGVWGLIVARAGSRKALLAPVASMARQTPALLAPAAFVLLEMIRGLLFTGFPWTPLGASQWPVTLVFTSARYVGVTGISLVVATVNAALYAAWRKSDRGKALIVAGIQVAALILLSGLGRRELAEEAVAGREVRVAALQGSFTEDEKWNLPLTDILSRFEALARAAAADRPEIMVWPETATASLLDREPAMVRRIAGLAAATGAAQLVGSLRDVGLETLNNGAFLIDRDGLKAGYAKMHLVPFGEYVPLWFKTVVPFARKLTQGLKDLTPGRAPDLIPLPGGGRAGVAVCYEAIFPAHGRNLARTGADVFINITNDTWYGLSAATYQHALGPIARSVECGRWTVRCANTGATLVIGPDGRFGPPLALFKQGVAGGRMRTSAVRTPYVRWGDLPVIVWLILAAIFSLRRGIRRG